MQRYFHYAVNKSVSRWNGRDRMDDIRIFISRLGGFTHRVVWIGGHNYFVCNSWFLRNMNMNLINLGYCTIKRQNFSQIIPKIGCYCQILTHSNKGRWAAMVPDACLGVNCEFEGFSLYWAQKIGFELNFMVKYRGMGKNNKTGPHNFVKVTDSCLMDLILCPIDRIGDSLFTLISTD